MNCVTEKCVHAGCQKSLTDDYKSHFVRLDVIHLMSYADQGEQFLQCFVTGHKMWVNCAAPKTKKASMQLATHIISFSKRIWSSVNSREEHGSYFFRPWKCALHGFPSQWKHKLLSVTVVQLRVYRRSHCRRPGLLLSASWFGMIMAGHVLQTGPATHYDAMAGRLWATISMVVISLQVIYISFDALKSTWLVSDLWQIPT